MARLWRVTTNVGSMSIVKSVINLSRDLRINVVAEGIETCEQLNFLRLNHCNEGQGEILSASQSRRNEIGPHPAESGSGRS